MVEHIVRKYLGIPYKHRSRGPDFYDCWGIIIKIYADLGYKLWDIEEEYNESFNWKNKSLFVENYHKEWQKVKEPELFDGVLFNSARGMAIHAGIYLGDNKFLHCCRAGVVIGRLSDPRWKNRIEGYYKLKVRN